MAGAKPDGGIRRRVHQEREVREEAMSALTDASSYARSAVTLLRDLCVLGELCVAINRTANRDSAHISPVANFRCRRRCIWRDCALRLCACGDDGRPHLFCRIRSADRQLCASTIGPGYSSLIEGVASFCRVHPGTRPLPGSRQSSGLVHFNGVVGDSISKREAMHNYLVWLVSR